MDLTVLNYSQIHIYLDTGTRLQLYNEYGLKVLSLSFNLRVFSSQLEERLSLTIVCFTCMERSFDRMMWVQSNSFQMQMAHLWLVSTKRYGSVRYGSGPNTLIQLVFPLPKIPLLDRRGVCRKVAIDDKVRQ